MKLNEIAAKYIGITEKPNNGGFSDPEFERRMKKDGEWQRGWAWCCCFMQLCVIEWMTTRAFISKPFGMLDLIDEIDQAITPSVKTTFENLVNLGYQVYTVPKEGDIAVWLTYKNGKPTGTGHIAIVDTVGERMTMFQTIDGNTNAEGSREGDCVARKWRKFKWAEMNGLRLMGFIRLEEKL